MNSQGRDDVLPIYKAFLEDEVFPLWDFPKELDTPKCIEIPKGSRLCYKPQVTSDSNFSQSLHNFVQRSFLN